MSTPDDLRVSELQELIKDVPASSIPVSAPAKEEAPQKIDLNKYAEEFWSQKANSLLEDYRYGKNLSLFSDSDFTLTKILKKIINSLCSTIINEHQKRGVSTEHLKPIFQILESSSILLAKEIEKKELPSFEILSIIASLQGAMNNITANKKGMR